MEDVKFHDGTDFDATAAKWNFDRILDPEVKSWVRPYYEEIDKVEAVDKYTLRIQMKEPSGSLPLALAGYFQGVPMASPKSFETHGKDWVRHPTGTGPYVLKEWVPGKHVVLEKNPNYFKKGLPYLDTLEYREAFVIGVAQTSALVAGISRDGVTMGAGLARGMDHSYSARFAFLLATPVILAAGVLKIPDLFGPLGTGIHGQVLFGSILSGVGAYLSVRFLMKYFQTRTLTPFAIYCLVVGLGSIVYLGVIK